MTLFFIFRRSQQTKTVLEAFTRVSLWCVSSVPSVVTAGPVLLTCRPIYLSASPQRCQRWFLVPLAAVVTCSNSLLATVSCHLSKVRFRDFLSVRFCSPSRCYSLVPWSSNQWETHRANWDIDFSRWWQQVLFVNFARKEVGLFAQKEICKGFWHFKAQICPISQLVLSLTSAPAAMSRGKDLELFNQEIGKHNMAASMERRGVQLALILLVISPYVESITGSKSEGRCLQV